MKWILVFLFAVALAKWDAEAQPYAAPGGATAPSSESARTNAPTAEDLAYYSALNRQEFEFATQIKLLSELEQEHRKRAEEARKGEQADKAKWETDLAQELADKASGITKLTNDVTKQRLAFEQAHKPLNSSVFAIRARITANGQTPEEIAFLTKLDERLWGVEQELSAALDEVNGLTAQIATNTVPEDMAPVSLSLQENGRRVKQLQKEESDLELKKLEFQALRKR